MIRTSLPFIWSLIAIFCSSSAFAYKPTDPTVQAMVQKGIKHLEKQIDAKTHYPTLNPFEGGMGERVLAGYAHIKVEHDPTNPVVKKGMDAARFIVNGLPGKDPGGHSSLSVYNLGVCAMLIAEVDPPDGKKLLEKIADLYRRLQYRNGGYGYLGDETGDVSQTQYAMLGLWTVDHKGVSLDYKGVPATVSWLLRVQDPAGGWPYQGVDPGPRGRIKQTRVTPSMGIAGGSAVLIAGDILRTWGYTSNADDPGIDGLPESVKLDLGIKEEIRRPEIPPEPLLKSIQEVEVWLGKNSPDPGKLKSSWPYYQLYTLERYESFKELAFDRPKDESPSWYNSGVEYLQERQMDDGGFQPALMTSGVATSFAVLFLIRSTQKAIEQSQQGALAGGFGLPGDTTKIRVDGTQIKGEPIAGAVTDLLDMLEGDDTNALEGKSLPEDMELPTEPKARKIQIERLERLVRGSSSWQARRVAARLLGQSDEIQVVPSLIYALDDPDTTVRTFARDGLRFISRKFEGFGMEIQPGEKQDYGELRKAQRLWREWYLTMDPGYIFVTQ